MRIADIENLVVKADKGVPVLVRDVAKVELGPDERRGITELNGEGEVVAGIVVARYGQNALDVIRNVKAKVAEIASGLPEGVSLQTVYDRSDLIHRAIDNLTDSQDPNTGVLQPSGTPAPIYRPEIGRTFRFGLRWNWSR